MGKNFKEEAVPKLQYENSTENGLTHISPFSKIVFSKFGPNGNFGLPRGYLPGNVDDFKNAEQDYTLTTDALTGTGENPLVNQYFAWLKGIEQKVRSSMHIMSASI